MSVIIALDFENKEKSLEFLKKFDKPLYVKVGMELFYGEGTSVVKEIKQLGHKIFLDLKLHDIPNTVKSAMKNLAKMGVDMVNLHASGGIKMMQEAKNGLIEGANGGNVPLLIAVTQLTSTSSNVLKDELLISETMENTVVHYAKNAKIAGLDGVVCSPLEVAAIKATCGKEFLTVTPGIRNSTNSKDDQVRITTPADARKIGTDYIVVGRPITRAENVNLAYEEINFDFMGK